jgi:hypothetical protein
MPARKKRKPHALQWVVEPIEDERSYLERPMFGCLGVYLHGRLCLLLSSGEEPWNGLLIPTDHPYQEAIRQDFPEVVQHPVLKKWLYLPEVSENFELAAQDIVDAIRLNDQRFGVEPAEKRPCNKPRRGGLS